MKKLFITLLTIIVSHLCKAQGCSDAGFCTLGSLKLHNQDTATNHQLTLMLTAGIGDQGVFSLSPAIQYDRRIMERWNIQLKLTTNYATGSLATTSGLGDLYLASTHTLSNTKWKTDFTMALKMPLTNSNLKEGNLALPMGYQSSLGTWDVIAGLNFSNIHWQLALGWQQPITNQNDNEFIPADWNSSDAEKFLPTNKFQREADALLRIAYQGRISEHFVLTGGLLGIYHIAADHYTDPVDQSSVRLAGSRGLTLNLTLMTGLKISERTFLNITFGAPVVAREARPDGLTRSFVITPELKWKF